MYKTITAVLLLCLLSAYAGSADYGYTSAKGEVETMFSRLLGEVQSNQDKYEENADYLIGLVTDIAIPSLDVNRFSKITLGKHWKSATEPQRTAFTNALRDTLIRSYSKSLNLLTSVTRVEFLPEDPAAETQKERSYYKVPSKLIFTSGEAPLSIVYVVYRPADKWLIFDLIIDGLSIARQLRSSYNREITEKGLPAVIDRLNNQSVSTN